MLALSPCAHLFLREGKSVPGDITSLPLRKVSARKMHGGDHHDCGQCQDESKGSGP